MATLELTAEQVAILKVIADHVSDVKEEVSHEVAEALEISNSDRGLDEDGEETDDYDPTSDPAMLKLEEVVLLIGNLPNE